MTEVAFWILAIVSVAAALSVVFLRDLFRAALLLVLCFFTIAGIFVTLNADFLAAVQVLIYIGAVAVLMLFAVMLTRGMKKGNPFSRFSFPALLVSGLILATFVTIVVNTDWKTLAEAPGTAVTIPVDTPTTNAIATALFDKQTGFVLPFEIASVLLLAAIIGAIVLGMERK